MESGEPRRLIVNADDFGRSGAINAAVIQAHEEGILTSASLMVNGEAFNQAVELARAHPKLGVGLHLTLVCGKPTLSPAQIPSLVGSDGMFTDNPVVGGTKYFFSSAARAELRQEIRAQFEKFRMTGLPLDHLNGHLHLHLHPAVLPILCELFAEFGVTRARLTHEPAALSFRLEKGRWFYRSSHALIFRILSARARPLFERAGLRHTDQVYGLLQDAHADEAYLLRLLPHLGPGSSEFFSHPSTTHFRHELAALTSPRVRDMIAQQNIKLIRYQDL